MRKNVSRGSAAGPLKVFVHGWATDSSVWDPVVPEIAPSGDFLLVGLPGHGGKGRWLEPTLEPAVREITAAISGADATGAVGIGWSLGAQALLQIAASRPGLLNALILVGATPRFVATEGFPHGQSKALVKRMILDMKSDPRAALERFYPLNFTDEERKTREAVEFIDRYRYPGPVVCTHGEYGSPPGCYPEFNYRDLTAALEALYSTDMRSILVRIDTPALVVHGSEDAVCPPGAGEFIAGAIKGAEFFRMEGAGHAPFLTQSAAFVEAVNGFLRKVTV